MTPEALVARAMLAAVRCFARFSVKSVNTIDSHVEALMKRGVVTDVRNLTSVMLPDSLGRDD